jgi:hypothetical protein
MNLDPDSCLLPQEMAHKVFDVLVHVAGASEHSRNEFVYHYTLSDRPPTEWRFGGTLGFGGKFWRANDKWYVTCYREDGSVERQKTIDEANASLAALRAEFKATL